MMNADYKVIAVCIADINEGYNVPFLHEEIGRILGLNEVHNIIVIGDNDDDMVLAVEKLIRIGGGITMFKDGKELGTHVLEIAGLMTDADMDEVTECLDQMHETAKREQKKIRKLYRCFILLLRYLIILQNYRSVKKCHWYLCRTNKSICNHYILLA